MRSLRPIKHKLTDVTEIPKDIIMGLPVLSVTGISELSLENHGGIIEYTDEIIRVRTKTGQFKIYGKNIHVDYYTNDEIRLNGRIDSIEFIH